MTVSILFLDYRIDIPLITLMRQVLDQVLLGMEKLRYSTDINSKIFMLTGCTMLLQGEGLHWHSI